MAFDGGSLSEHSGERILITGSNGFIGVRVVDFLLRSGIGNLRCFVRPSGNRERLEAVLEAHGFPEGVEVVAGDLLSPDDCRRATEGVTRILHLAAGFEKSFAAAFMNSCLATRNLLEAFCEKGDPRRFVNVSSFSVYSNLKLRSGAVMDEDCPLEDAFPERNDSYGFGKRKQEDIVREFGETRGLPWVILRPGAVFGPGKKDLNGRVGMNTFGFFVQVGGGHRVPLTYVDNCAEAVVLAAFVPGAEQEVFNVVDDDLPTARQFLKAYRKRTGMGFYLRVPYWTGYLFSKCWQDYSRRSKRQLPPVFNVRRCTAEWKRKRFSNRRIKEGLGWQPRVTMDEAMDRFLAQFG